MSLIGFSGAKSHGLPGCWNVRQSGPHRFSKCKRASSSPHSYQSWIGHQSGILVASFVVKESGSTFVFPLLRAFSGRFSDWHYHMRICTSCGRIQSRFSSGTGARRFCNYHRPQACGLRMILASPWTVSPPQGKSSLLGTSAVSAIHGQEGHSDVKDHRTRSSSSAHTPRSALSLLNWALGAAREPVKWALQSGTGLA